MVNSTNYETQLPTSGSMVKGDFLIVLNVKKSFITACPSKYVGDKHSYANAQKHGPFPYPSLFLTSGRKKLKFNNG